MSLMSLRSEIHVSLSLTSRSLRNYTLTKQNSRDRDRDRERDREWKKENEDVTTKLHVRNEKTDSRLDKKYDWEESNKSRQVWRDYFNIFCGIA